LTSIPIRVRVASAFTVAMAVVLGVTGWILYARVDSQLSAALDRNLRLRAADLTVLVRRPGDAASLSDAGGGPLFERGEVYAQLLDGDGAVLDATPQLRSSALLTRVELEAALGGAVMLGRDSVPGLDEPSRLLATPLERQGRRVVLVVGATAEDRAETLSSLRISILVAASVALLLATFVGYRLAGVALRPVEAMRRRAAEISASTPGERLPVAHTGDEIERLATTLNDMLGRLENAIQRERGFVADAGHELRTPLALLRTELELALRHGDDADDLRAAVHRASEEVERLSRLADGLLLIARADSGELELRREPLDVDGLFETLVSRFAWRAADAARPLSRGGSPGLVVEGDRIRLEQALDNLLENALRHGAGPIALDARVSTEGAIELHVCDGGPGIPPAFLPQAFERFTRPDIDRGSDGSGLGLAIVKTVAVAHGGEAHVANRPGHGTDAWIVLPAG
jgi:heavy metal sensor kinase